MTQSVIKIKSATFTLIDVKQNHGELIVQLPDNVIYKYYWGAMGCGIVDFIKHCSPDYVIRNLIGTRGCFTYCNKRTFKALRYHIRVEMRLPFYKHMAFQKSMRAELKKYQKCCYSADSFISGWDVFVNHLEYRLIESTSDRVGVYNEFKGISEVWHFCETKHNDEYIKLTKLITQLKNKLK
jgi:hypothetical protein